MSRRPDDAEQADIAIIGMAGCYAGAANVRSYWRNIINKVDAIAPASAEWTGPYLDPDSSANDRIYTNRGGFLGDLAEFDPSEFGIMPSSVDGGEPDHYLALRLARDALIDAGYGPEQRPLDGERAGVILGRGTYMNRGYSNLLQHGLALDQTLDLVRQVRPDFTADDINALRAELKKQLPSFNAEMAPGLVPNVTTGIIANRLNLMGPNFIIDAACASSLVALELAIRELRSGKIDLMLSGGVQAHTPPQLFMIFCQIGALTRGNIRPFDKNAAGTLLGEGAGLIALKRLADAERDEDKIYAVIKGVGSSSDGRAKGLLAPRLEGEVLALRRAYQGSGIDPSSVGLVEAHGTGIALGDATEVAALTQVFGERQGTAPRVALGSVKSMISHCIPAAGSASIIKSALALHHKVLPPTLCDEINPELGLDKSPFYVNTEARPWVHGGEHGRRAGVNAFGFGGVNAHVILEEYRRPETSPALPADTARTASPAIMGYAPGSPEIFVLSAESPDALAAQALGMVKRVQAQPSVDAAGLAKALAEREASTHGAHRLAVVAADSDDLIKKLESCAERIQSKGKSFKTRSGIYYDHGQPPGKLAYLFPGEGAQYAGMLRELAIAYPNVRAWFDLFEATFGEDRGYRPSDAVFPPATGLDQDARSALEARLYDMDLASESVFTASQGVHSLLRGAGLRAQAMVGHSTGENSALVASGHLRASDPEKLARIAHEFNRVYRELEADGKIASGTLLTVGALAADKRDEILADFGEKLTVAMDNCPNQVVVFGNPEDTSVAHKRFTAAGAICAELPFGRAYHTELFTPVADAFRKFYATLDMGAGDVPLYSCATAAPFPQDTDGVRNLACDQWATKVRFADTLQRLYEDGYRVFVEVGPSANLSSFVTDTLRDRDDIVSVATNSRRQPDLQHLYRALAQLFTLGVEMDLSGLYADRDVPDVNLDSAPDESKVKMRLNLNVPTIKPPTDWAMPPLPNAEPAVRTHRERDAGETGQAEAEKPKARPSTPAEPQRSPVSSDPRTAGLQSHFALMQEFLESQARVLGVGAADSAGAAPVQPGGDSIKTLPLLGEITHQDESSLTYERTYSLDHDLFLQDHCIGGHASENDPSLHPIPVVPFTFSMEMIAQAALRLAGEHLRVVAFEEVAGSRWLGLPLGEVSVRVTVERVADMQNKLRGRIFVLQAGAPDGGILAFEAQVLLAEHYSQAPAPRAWGASQAYPAKVNPEGELYSRGMFHGPRLQGVKRIGRWADEAVEADLEVLPTNNYFVDTTRPQFSFDAALLDAAGQVAGYWLTEKYTWDYNCFPYYMQRMDFYAPPPAAGAKILCRADVKLTNDTTIVAELDLIDEQGKLIARAAHWTDRRFNVPAWLHHYRLDPPRRFLSSVLEAACHGNQIVRHMHAFPEHFLDEGSGVWKNMVAHMTLGHEGRRQFHALPVAGPRREEWLVGRIAAKEAVRDWLARHYDLHVASADIDIHGDEQGKPYAVCKSVLDRPMPAISLAHSRRQAAAVAGDPEPALGLDYQQLQSINGQALETGALTEAEKTLIAQYTGEARLRAAVAMWCAKEAAAKAAGSGLQGRPLDWTVTQIDMASATGQGHVVHKGVEYNARLYFDSEAVLAVCAATRSPSVNTQPPAAQATH